MIFEVFTDPVLRAPMIGSMLMCLGASVIGVLAYLRKSSLLGEALSHAAYPGVILGALFPLLFGVADPGSTIFSISLLFGALATSLLGIFVIYLIQNQLNIRPDAALCFVLSSFFGIGVLLASRVQFSHTTLYVQSLSYLYGQAATMTDLHIVIYALISSVTIAMAALLFKELKTIAFDRTYAISLGVNVKFVDALLFFLIAFSTVAGIRSVGVVLMSAMLIAPAVAARQFTHSLSKMLFIAPLVGMFSAFLGTLLSLEGNALFSVVLPTGPMIVLVATAICLASIFFAPEKGIVFRLVRKLLFQMDCLSENLIKDLWRKGGSSPLSQIAANLHASKLFVRLLLVKLSRNGWVQREGRAMYHLTVDGNRRAEHIVRLHRLWELYLADFLGMGVERVHKSAEEMEHILTPEIVSELVLLLKDPKLDPHHQPIPREPL